MFCTCLVSLKGLQRRVTPTGAATVHPCGGAYSHIIKICRPGGYPRIGHPAFNNYYEILSATAMLYTTWFGLCILKSGPLPVPPVGISKALRFRIHEWWWKGPDSWGVSPMSESLTPYWCTSQNGVTYRRQCIRRCFHKNVFFAYGCLLKNVRPKLPRHGRR